VKTLRQTCEILQDPTFEGDALELTFEAVGDFTLHCYGDAATFSKRGDVIELSRDGDTRRIQADGRTFRIFFDASSIEIFVNDGEYVFSSRVYPAQQARHSISGDVKNLTLYRLATAT